MRNYLRKNGYNTVSDEFYELMDSWMSWYKGTVESFHHYSQYNGRRKIRRTRASLGMAKKICEDWANLLLNEKVSINIDQKDISDEISSVLRANDFNTRSNRLIELTFALGTGAFVEYIDRGQVKIDYVRGNMVFPLTWENGVVTECAFGGERMINGKPHLYLNMHVLVNGSYCVINRLFEKHNNALNQVALAEGMEEYVMTGSTRPLFQIIRPNIINNTDSGGPMGVSVFANSIDILKGIDLVYDSYNNEFRLGKKRIIVPAGMAQLQSGENGIAPLFDDNDTEFYAITDQSLTDLREINMELRATPHEIALQKHLSLLSAKCGLGSNRYNYSDSLSVRTATEINSDRTSMLQTIRKHEIILEQAIKELVRSVAFLCGYGDDFGVTLSFDDSIVDSVAEKSERALIELQNGIIDETEYLVRVYDMTEQQAYEKVKTMKKRAAEFVNKNEQSPNTI